MTDYVETYPCPTCEKSASGRGHLCHPRAEALPFTCEFCSKSVDDARHVCSGMLDKIEYICKKFGRLSIYDSSLCAPELISAD